MASLSPFCSYQMAILSDLIIILILRGITPCWVVVLRQPSNSDINGHWLRQADIIKAMVRGYNLASSGSTFSYDLKILQIIEDLNEEPIVSRCRWYHKRKVKWHNVETFNQVSKIGERQNYRS